VIADWLVWVCPWQGVERRVVIDGPGAARCRLVVEHNYHPLVILRRELLVAASTWREYVSPIQILMLSGLLMGDAECGTFQHILNCLFRDDNPLAEAESWQPARASHFISEGTANA
jgi:hypothetical protein